MPNSNDPAGTSAFVDAGCLSCFLPSTSSQTRSDVLDSTLLAQLVADKAYSRINEPKDWYSRYDSTLEQVGWAVDKIRFSEYSPTGEYISLAKVVSVALEQQGEDQAEKDLCQKALKEFDALPDSDRRVTVYRDFALAEHSANVLLSICEGTKLSCIGIYLHTKQTIERAFDYEYLVAELEGPISIVSFRASLNEEVYAKLRQMVLEKLGQKRHEFILNLFDEQTQLTTNGTMHMDIEHSHQAIDTAEWTPERMQRAEPRRRVLKHALGMVSFELPGHDPSAQRATPPDEEVNPVPDPTKYPFRAIGKLYFVSGGKDYVGSASVVAADGLMTVAHNLYDAKDGWSSNLHFVPASTDGHAPFGSWGWAQCWIQEGFYRHDKDEYDFGLVRLYRGGNERRNVGDVVGWLGVRAELDPRQTFVDVAYPGAFYDGTRMVECTGKYSVSLADGKVVGKHGWLGQGASGGPWLLASDLGVANGIHSFSHDDFPNDSFSPYFRQWMIDFINRHFTFAAELPRVA